MTTSSPELAPRGMDFLYSRNRLNVATSRARCVAVVVASPDLWRVRARTPDADAARERVLPLRRAGGPSRRRTPCRRADLEVLTLGLD